MLNGCYDEIRARVKDLSAVVPVARVSLEWTTLWAYIHGGVEGNCSESNAGYLE